MARIPINHFSDKDLNPNGTITQDILSYPKYFKNSQNQFEEVNCSIVSSDDIGWEYEVKKGVYELHINSDGTFEVNHLGDVFKLKLLGLGFYNSDTKERLFPSQTQFTLSTPTISDNSATWTLPLSSSYKIEYTNNNLKDILTISNDAKTWLKNHKPSGWTADNTWVGLIYDIDLSNSVMVESKDTETEEDIKFISDGKVKHKIIQAWAKHSDYDPLNPDDLIWKRRRIIKNDKYVEAIKASALDSVDGQLVFNTNVTFQQGVSDYSGCEDNYLCSAAATTNYGGDTNRYIFQNNDAFIIKYNLSSISSAATVLSARAWIYEDTRGGAGTLNYYVIKRNWGESTSTYNTYDGSNNWTTAGAADTTNDTYASFTSSANENGGWTKIWITDQVQDWVDGSVSNYGYRVSRIYDSFDSSEDGTTSRRPYLTVTYVEEGDFWAYYQMGSAVVTTASDEITAGNLSNPQSISTFDTNYTGSTTTDPILLTKPLNTSATSHDTAIAQGSYFTITLTPDEGKVLNFDSLSFNACRGGSGTPRGWILRSSIDSYAADIDESVLSTVLPTFESFSVDLTAAAYQGIASAITFRIYMYAPTAYNLCFDDILFIGTSENATTPSVSPSGSPSISPSGSPSISPSVSPSGSPSVSPSISPSASPSPSTSPSGSPSVSPSVSPSGSPSVSPSISPSKSPSVSPSGSPSVSPSGTPSVSPSGSPSVSPSGTPSISPSRSPSMSPSTSPSISPSTSPSGSPSGTPSISPSRSPSVSLSGTPSVSPSISPSGSPSASPSGTPSISPSRSPSISPSVSPSRSPSYSPSRSPSWSPSISPSASPPPGNENTYYTCSVDVDGYDTLSLYIDNVLVESDTSV